jgi:predicted DNA-binding transcriptional regulator AlpA
LLGAVIVAKRIVRPKEAWQRLGIGHSNFHENYVRTGRVRLVRLGPRSVGVIEEELDALIDELAAARDRELIKQSILESTAAAKIVPPPNRVPGHRRD